MNVHVCLRTQSGLKVKSSCSGTFGSTASKSLLFFLIGIGSLRALDGRRRWCGYTGWYLCLFPRHCKLLGPTQPPPSISLISRLCLSIGVCAEVCVQETIRWCSRLNSVRFCLCRCREKCRLKELGNYTLQHWRTHSQANHPQRSPTTDY